MYDARAGCPPGGLLRHWRGQRPAEGARDRCKALQIKLPVSFKCATATYTGDVVASASGETTPHGRGCAVSAAPRGDLRIDGLWDSGAFTCVSIGTAAQAALAQIKNGVSNGWVLSVTARVPGALETCTPDARACTLYFGHYVNDVRTGPGLMLHPDAAPDGGVDMVMQVGTWDGNRLVSGYRSHAATAAVRVAEFRDASRCSPLPVASTVGIAWQRAFEVLGVYTHACPIGPGAYTPAFVLPFGLQRVGDAVAAIRAPGCAVRWSRAPHAMPGGHVPVYVVVHDSSFELPSLGVDIEDSHAATAMGAGEALLERTGVETAHVLVVCGMPTDTLPCAWLDVTALHNSCPSSPVAPVASTVWECAECGVLRVAPVCACGASHEGSARSARVEGAGIRQWMRPNTD